MKKLALFALLLASCGDGTGQPRIAHPAVAIGTAPHAITVGAWSLSLSVAKVGFGPALFCAGRASSQELCPAALAELAATATIDALSPNEQKLGTVNGFVGTVRSVGFAYAYTWSDLQSEPQPTSASVAGHSAHLEGTATSAGKTIAFSADVDVVPLLQGSDAVRVTGIEQSIDERTAKLEVKLDPTRWLEHVDFDELAAAGATKVTLEKGSRAWNAIVVSMTAIAPATFGWK